MAIVEMKKLRLMAPRSQKEALLKELIRMGCVEFSEIENEIQDAGYEAVVSKESSGLLTFRTQLNTLNSAIGILDRYAPVKKGLLSAKPEISGSDLLDCTKIGSSLTTAETIVAAEERMKRLTAEESRVRSTLEALTPWMDLDMPIDTTETETCSVLLGTISAKIELGSVQNALEQVTGEAELFSVSDDRTMHYVLVVYVKSAQQGIMDCLRTFGFSLSAVSGLSGTAAENREKASATLTQLAGEKEDVATSIRALAGERENLAVSADAVSSQIARAEAEERLYGMKSVIVMQGWMPKDKESELAVIFDRYECAWESEEPSEEEYPDVPVKLRNNMFTNGLNMVTEMYSLPAYGSVDPNPLMAPFFILFYGLMMADMGYGLLMIIAAVVALVKIKPREGSLSFCQLLLWGGISTFVMGAITGGFFGDALVKIGELTGQPEGWGTLPALFSPLNDTLFVLIGAMALGLVHLNTGMVINAVKKYKRHQIADIIWEEGALWITLAGIVLFVLKKGNIAGIPVVLVIGLVMVFYGGTRGATGIGKLTSIFGTLYNTATGWFGDILSYSRIMALMLAGSVIAQVFNTIGAIANNLVFFLVIFLIGHALNFGLNLLGCYVHDLRLQCLEYFGKFYEDGGRAFAPLRFKTKYYNIKEQ
mgnify:CR=1 FL=1